MDCAAKIATFESNAKYFSNWGGSFYVGAQAYGARLFMICYLSQFILDYYHAGQNVSEFWQPARYNYQSGLDYDIHEPFTDGFNKVLTSSWSTPLNVDGMHPNVKGDINIV